MTIIDLQAARVTRAQALPEGVRRIGANTEIVDPDAYVTCACAYRFKGRSAITRDPDGFIGMCPNCLENASKGDLIKGEKMSDTGVNDGHKPTVTLSLQLTATTHEELYHALVGLMGQVRANDFKSGELIIVERPTYTSSIAYFNTAATPGEEKGEAPKPVRET